MKTEADRSSWKGLMGEVIATDSLEAVGPTTLMRVTTGISKVAIGLIDGPVAAGHPDLATENIRSLSAATDGRSGTNRLATTHGIYVAGILAARRGSSAPAIC